MKNYCVVRANSTSGPWIVERQIGDLSNSLAFFAAKNIESQEQAQQIANTRNYIERFEWFEYDDNCNGRRILINRAYLIEQQQSDEAEEYLEYSEQYDSLVSCPDGEFGQSHHNRCRWYRGLKNLPAYLPNCIHDFLDCQTSAYCLDISDGHHVEHLDQCHYDSKSELMDCERGYMYAVQVAATGQYINYHAWGISDFENAERIARQNAEEFPLSEIQIVAEMANGEVSDIWTYNSETDCFVSQ